MVSSLAQKQGIGKLIKEMISSIKDNSIKTILEWVIFEKIDKETASLLIMISCSQEIGGLTQIEIFRLRELVANMDD